ncbi:maleylacetate reductase [Nocardioides sp. Root151]|uniref:maleylacetate reductase n=1 Tax=Nocardioides sp. Root151 TaxID=1736475 RepID=UPI000702CE77|nr:maleylacetate reductase [Nocardioides sp. Root151]KQZ66798.1 Maleylacetate reductase [Nocardioides sp. Root151]
MAEPVRSFVYEALPMRVVFGRGRLAAVADEVARLGLRRVLVLSTPGQRALAEKVEELLGDTAVGIFDQARMHVPVETVAGALRVVAELEADGCVSIGGGSTIGLGKALALRRALPVVAVPTTYAGSEMTPIWGLTENSRKQTGRDPAVLPRTVVYDPDLTTSLPPAVSATSGLNAMAHAMEALYAPDGSPVVAAMAEQGVRALALALPVLVKDPADASARANALEGAWLCGACLGATTMGLHHKLCHVLGGMLDLPHADTHSVVLPHVAAFNLAQAPGARSALARALGDEDPAGAIGSLADQVGAPRRLSDLGVRESDLAAVVDEVLANPYANPRPVDRPALVRLLEGAM